MSRACGQVNASTRERTTDFFFEVPPPALAGGLERLCQMLVEPDFSLERQRREREVIHAEFIAWSRNPEAQRQFTLLQSVSARHPLSAFHAGNRYSLPLESPAFQQGLRQFHQCHYQGGQLTLSLVGPQSLDELAQLGRRYGELFAQGTGTVRDRPPALLEAPLRQPTAWGARHDWLFAHDSVPQGAEQALELLLVQLNDSRPGGWLDALRKRGWLQDCKAQQLHAHAGQLLWHVQLQLSDEACLTETRELLHGWLGFLRRQDSKRLNERFARLQQRRAQAASALELAQRDSADRPFTGLTAQGLAAFEALLDDLPPRPLETGNYLPRRRCWPQHRPRTALHCQTDLLSTAVCRPHASSQPSICAGMFAHPCVNACGRSSNTACAPCASAPGRRRCNWTSKPGVNTGNCIWPDTPWPWSPPARKR